jgi:hypothetical protein
VSGAEPLDEAGGSVDHEGAKLNIPQNRIYRGLPVKASVVSSGNIVLPFVRSAFEGCQGVGPCGCSK